MYIESKEEDDIAAQLGAGSAAQDAELDRLKDAAEAEILARANLIGRFAPLVAAFCHQRRAQLLFMLSYKVTSAPVINILLYRMMAVRLQPCSAQH